MATVYDVKVDRDANTINHQRLHQELSAALKGVVGVSTGDYGVRVHLDHKPSPAEGERAIRIVGKHNPQDLTAEQQEKQQEEAVLSTLRGKAWEDLTAAEREAALVRMFKKLIKGG